MPKIPLGYVTIELHTPHPFHRTESIENHRRLQTGWRSHDLPTFQKLFQPQRRLVSNQLIFKFNGIKVSRVRVAM